MTDPTPLASRYHGLATLDQFMSALRSNLSVRNPAATIAKGLVSKSVFYDILHDHTGTKVATLQRFCEAYDVELMVAVRKKP